MDGASAVFERPLLFNEKKKKKNDRVAQWHNVSDFLALPNNNISITGVESKNCANMWSIRPRGK